MVSIAQHKGFCVNIMTACIYTQTLGLGRVSSSDGRHSAETHQQPRMLHRTERQFVHHSDEELSVSLELIVLFLLRWLWRIIRLLLLATVDTFKGLVDSSSCVFVVTGLSGCGFSLRSSGVGVVVALELRDDELGDRLLIPARNAAVEQNSISTTPSTTELERDTEDPHSGLYA